MFPAVTRKALTGSLLVTASAIALASPAQAAHQKLFASNQQVGDAALSGRRVTQTDGVTQVRLDNGGIASFVDSASYTINEDGTVDLYSGSVTVTGSSQGAVIVRLADKGQASVIGADSAASFSVDAEGASGHVLTGSAQVALGNGSPQAFSGGQMWRSNGGTPRLVIANNEANVPSVNGSGTGGEEPAVLAVREGGPVAAAINGLPVVLGDGLAAAGATGDILAAARRVDQAFANPSLDTFPSGDFALLVAYAAQLEGAFGGQSFNGAQADIIRSYIQFLAAGGSGASFLTSYAGLTGQYLDLIRAGAVPSSFSGASLGQINAYLGYIDRTSGFGGLSAQNAALVDAYLAFLSGGGTAGGFTGTYTDLTQAYFAFLRGGGAPADFQQASLGLVEQYLAFLSDAGLADLLSSADQALLAAYLGGNGLAFAGQYETALGDYFAHLSSGKLPNAYSAVDPATLQAYLETLQATGLFAQILGSNAGFYSDYLAYVQGGGSLDDYSALNANIFATYGTQLEAYYDYLLQGGVPSSYGDLTQAQIAAYLSALDGAGASSAFLAQLTGFYSGYSAYVSGGGNPDVYTGLPVLALPTFANALNAYSTFLAGGGLPSGYSAEELIVLSRYLTALVDSGQADALLGGNSKHLASYFAFFSGLDAGGSVDGFNDLPIYSDYGTALTAYFAFLNGGGLPADYTALSQAQIQSYLAALGGAGGLGEFFGTDLAAFYTSYLAFVQSGGNAANFADLPVYADYASALSTYYAFLNGGGLPGDYTALTPAQVSAYLAALQNAGGFALQLGNLGNFYSAYFSHLGAGGTPDTFADLPIYGDYATALSAYFAFLDNGGLPADYTALTPAQISTYLTALNAAGGFNSQLGNLSPFYNAYFAHLSGGGTPATFSGLPTYATYVSALSSYFSYLDNGGLPAAYTALTPTQISAYLSALQGAGGFGAQLGNLSTFYSAYFLHLGGGGTPATFSGLPVYATYATALSAYFSFLDNGGLPADYTALTPAQISTYLTALNGAGGFGAQLGNLSTFYSAYFAHLSNGGTPATFSGLPVYADYLSAIQAFYAFVANGGLPSDYSSLTAAQIQAYLGALSGSGLLVGNFNGGDLSLLQAYLAFLTGGGNYDQFADLPVNVGPAGPLPQFATARVYRYSSDGGSVRDAATVDVEDDGRITAATGSVSATFDYTADEALVVEKGRAGNDVAWTRYARGTKGSSITNYQEHVMAGVPATNLPTSGNVAYKLIGGTAPTDAYAPTGQAGSFSGKFAVGFKTIPEIGLEMDVFVGERGWHVQTAKGAADPQFAGLFLQSDMSFADNGNKLAITNLEGNACSSNCSVSLFGSLFGEGAAHAGFAYLIDDNSDGGRSFVNGTSVFGMAGTALDILGVKPTITPPVVVADPNVWIFSGDGGRVGTAPTSTIEANGQITRTDYKPDGNNSVIDFDYSAASNVVRDFGQVEDVVAWSRYEQPPKTNLSNFQSHIMLGAPAINMPTSGQVDYALIGGTAPTNVFGPAGEAGSLTGNLSVSFGTTSLVGFDLDILLGTRGWHVQTTGGATDPTSGGITVGSNMRFEGYNMDPTGIAGNACTSYCNFSVFGGLFGDGASHAGLTYLLDDQSSGGRSYVNGIAIFGANAMGIGKIGTDPVPPQNTATVSTAFGNEAVISYRTAYLNGAGGIVSEGQMTNGGVGYQVFVNAEGDLEAFARNRDESFNLMVNRRDATIAETYDFGTMQLGRWSDGTLDHFNNANADLGPNQGLHYIITPAITNLSLLPSGRVDYTLQAATAPTLASGNSIPGVFDASLAIEFGTTSKIGIEGSMTFTGPDGFTYSFATPGGVAAPGRDISWASNGRFYFNADGTSTNGTEGRTNFYASLGDATASQFGTTYRTSLFDKNSVNVDVITGGALFGETPSSGGSTTVTPYSGSEANLWTVYSRFGLGSNGIQAFRSKAVTFDNDGNIALYQNSAGSNIGGNSSGIADTATEAGSIDGAIAWARFYDAGNNNGTLEYTGEHAITGTQAFNMPTSGLVTYNLIGGTRPTSNQGTVEPGSFVGALAVDFSAKKVGVNFGIEIGSYAWEMRTTGGAADPSNGGMNIGAFQPDFFGSLTVTGNNAASCIASCTGDLSGMLYGDGASHVGTVYRITDGSFQARGTAVFAAPGAAGTEITRVGPAPTYNYNPYFSVPDNSIASAPAEAANIAIAPDASEWDRFGTDVPQDALSISTQGGAIAISLADAEQMLGSMITFAQPRQSDAK